MLLCSECGAPLQEGGQCLDNFHALLALEWQVPDWSTIAHFYAVASYVLQHPESMNYTEAALQSLRCAVADALAGRATIEQIKKHMRSSADISGHVMRKKAM